MHEGQVHARGRVVQQGQVLGGAGGGAQHHLDAVGLEPVGIALAELGVGALGHAGGQHHPARRVGLQRRIGQAQQQRGQQHEGANRQRQVAQRQQG